MKSATSHHMFASLVWLHSNISRAKYCTVLFTVTQQGNVELELHIAGHAGAILQSQLVLGPALFVSHELLKN